MDKNMTLHQRFPRLGDILLAAVITLGITLPLMFGGIRACECIEKVHCINCCGCDKCPCKPEEIPTPAPRRLPSST